MGKRTGGLTKAAYRRLINAATNIEQRPRETAPDPHRNRRMAPDVTFPVMLLESLGGSIPQEEPGDARKDMREKAKFVRLNSVDSDNIRIFQVLVEDDCVLTVDGFVLTETITPDIEPKELQDLLNEASVTTEKFYASDVKAGTVFIRELNPGRDTEFNVTSTTPASNTTAANEVLLVSWWPDKVPELCTLAWPVTSAVPGGSMVLAADAGDRGVVILPPIASGGGSDTDPSTGACCKCVVITGSDLGINGVPTTTRWDGEVIEDITRNFDQGYLVVSKGTYRVTWNETRGEWVSILNTPARLGSSVFIYLNDGTDVSTETDREEIDVTVDIRELELVLSPDNGLGRVQAYLTGDLTIDDFREE